MQYMNARQLNEIPARSRRRDQDQQKEDKQKEIKNII